ncbi:MAG: PQQ-binding-like beta-propeller repeat protein [Actinomycetota bacterium]
MRSLISALLLLAALVPVVGHTAPPCEWRMFGHDLGRSMATTCTSIDALNVATLHPKWIFNANAPITAQPVVVEGVIYVGAADGTFYALRDDGTVKWTFTNTDRNTTSYGVFPGSAAVAEVAGTRVVVVSGASTLYVLDAANGARLASLCVDPRTSPTVRCNGSDDIIEIESSPAVIPHSDGTASIFTGMDYNEGGPGRAGMLKLTLAHGSAWTLTPDWKFDPEALVAYHSNVLSAGGPGQGCGGVWSSPTIDENAGLVYFNTSNCATSRYTNKSLYGGESIFAISMSSGALAWCYAPRPVNDLDVDFGATPNLLPNGRVGTGGKDGSYYSLGREPSRPANTQPSTACRGSSAQKPQWATQVSTGGSISGIIGTSAVGAVGGKDAIFVANSVPAPSDVTLEHPEHLTTLHALNAATGAVLWNAPDIIPAYAGPVYANGLLYIPETFGMNFSIYSADLGLPLWRFPMPAPSGPPAIVGNTIYIGSGVEPGSGTPVLSQVGALYAFTTATG